MSRARHRIAYLEDKHDGYTHAGIAIGEETGCLELWANEPNDFSEDRWDHERITASLEIEEDEPVDDDGYLVEERLQPNSLLGLANATLEGVDVVGDGRGMLELDRYRGIARLSRLVPTDALAVDDMTGFFGRARAHGRVWLYGGPALLFVDGARVDTGISTELAIIALHPTSAMSALALTDDGSAWHIVDGRATKLEAIASTQSYNGYWENPWSIAARGDALWVANGSEHLYCVEGDRVRAIELDAERVVVATDGRIWVQGAGGLRVGDGDRFEDVLVERELVALAAGRAGRVVCFESGPVDWWAKERGLSRDESASKLVIVDGGNVRELVLEETHCHFQATACTDGDLVWTAASPGVIAIEPGGVPYTRMTLRANRDANRELWDPMCTFAARVASALGGWDITRP